MKSVAAPRTGCEIISERHNVVVVQAHVCHTSQCSRQHLWQLQREINVFKTLMEVSVVNKSKTVFLFLRNISCSFAVRYEEDTLGDPQHSCSVLLGNPVSRRSCYFSFFLVVRGDNRAHHALAAWGFCKQNLQSNRYLKVNARIID